MTVMAITSNKEMSDVTYGSPPLLVEILDPPLIARIYVFPPNIYTM